MTLDEIEETIVELEKALREARFGWVLEEITAEETEHPRDRKEHLRLILEAIRRVTEDRRRIEASAAKRLKVPVRYGERARTIYLLPDRGENTIVVEDLVQRAPKSRRSTFRQEGLAELRHLSPDRRLNAALKRLGEQVDA